MDTDEIAKKAIKIILVTAGISLVFLIISPFFISPEEGSTLETLMLIPIIPIIMAAVILVVLARSDMFSRGDPFLPPYLRVIGLILFGLWILSFFVDNPFRS
ncbi:MAG: hypothetical protein A2675_04070 [Candidatus Yonathbacteria bacterium RIFCSPHIGHO2_01_FULL_51_10]|uniref:Uncharacterized protein n=1 Tax=Candidatus Yonathbacteria bacterium RIFCSPHIGHO2_01_FULL_51_10 TaxID=1802723 RepID=A0A1G2S408_9BACT|nr:MAG: hypothetical protein A2675_04070 [Candidatus Yonathbacteria bacterium RIFCSPHIGHO2_01_FULL_51_10]